MNARGIEERTSVVFLQPVVILMDRSKGQGAFLLKSHAALIS